MPIHDPLDGAPTPSVPLTSAVTTVLVNAIREAREAAGENPPVYDLARDVLEPALAAERADLEQAKAEVRATWTGLDRALQDEQRAKEAIAQLEVALAALAGNVRRENAATHDADAEPRP